jgi:hypothetical protein
MEAVRIGLRPKPTPLKKTEFFNIIGNSARPMQAEKWGAFISRSVRRTEFIESERAIATL